ncbi:MAG: DEAD/DEAH box helicase family protein, partial [Ktedonobacterales bacterium]
MADQMAQDAEHVTLEPRGRDLALVPPAALWALDDAALYTALFGSHEALGAEHLFSRDRRAKLLRAQPMAFARIKSALLAHDAYPLHVAFEERPALPQPPQRAFTPRPYQQDALTAWRAEGCRGVVILPTGAGKTLVGALAIAEVTL